MEPPVAKKIPHVTNVHGHELKDDYFWFKDKKNPDVIKYLEQENEYTKNMMKHTEKFQEKLYWELRNRIKEDDESYPVKKGDYFYYWRTEKDKQYRIYCRKKGMNGKEEIMLDLNIMAEGHDYFDMGSYKINPSNKLIAYSIDTKGYENYTIYIKNLETGELLEDRIVDVTGKIIWGDDQYFFYLEMDDVHRPYLVKKHILGVKEDELIFKDEDKRRYVGAFKTLDNRFLIINSDSITSSEYHFLDLQNKGELTVFQPRKDKWEYSINYHDGYFYILSNDNGAENFKLYRTKINELSFNKWELIIDHNDNIKLDAFEPFKDFFVLHTRENGLPHIKIMDTNTFELKEVEMPESSYAIYSQTSLNLEFNTTFYRFLYTSLVSPMTTYDYDINTGKLIKRKVSEIKGYNANDYITERLFAEASDGVKIPLSLVKRKDVTTPAPLLLYGYGSYGFSIDPSFNSNRLSLLDRGIIFVIAHIRGGEEMGRKWYEDGKFLNKKNTFTDFIAAAKFLINNNYTKSSMLLANGRSAGGLLMGAVSNMAPELFKAIIAEVPFVDVINTMMDASIPLTTGEYEEWGNPADKTFFEYMLSYSPYDNVEAKDYPNMLVTAGLNDPRVHFHEPTKWVAKLRAMKTDNNLLLYKINMGSGHFGSTGRFEYLKEIAFVYAFMLDILGLIEK